MKDFTITHIAGTELSLPMLFKFIEAKGKSFQFQADDGTEYASKESIEIKFKENFWLCAYQTTQEFWEAVVEVSPNLDLKSKPSFFKGKTRPVEQVSWDHIKLFNEALNTLINIGEVTFIEKPKNLGLASIPSETQWEYAANGGKNTVFSGSDQLEDVGWYFKNSNGSTMPVALKAANSFGLYDMSGNVWEWCSDYFIVDITKIPQNGSPNIIKGKYKALRGGPYLDYAHSNRQRDRNRGGPDGRIPSIGFRLLFPPSSNEKNDQRWLIKD